MRELVDGRHVKRRREETDKGEVLVFELLALYSIIMHCSIFD